MYCLIKNLKCWDKTGIATREKTHSVFSSRERLVCDKGQKKIIRIENMK